MSAFERGQRRFDCLGVQLTRAIDNCAPGKYPILENVRTVLQGTLQPRAGLQPVTGASFGSPIHTVTRFADASPFATYPELYVIGAGTNLYIGPPTGGFFPSHDSGYSGNPLSLAEALPPQSPQPYLYIVDTARMRKTNSNGDLFQLGLTPPTQEPGAVLQPLGVNIVQDFNGAIIPWHAVGTQATAGAGVNRVNTTINQILYDSGTTGYASIVPASMVGIDQGILVQVGSGGTQENAAITKVTIAVQPTTIAAILYDAGSTGLCTIQPAASLGTGQILGPSSADYRARYGVPTAVPRGQLPAGAGVGTPQPTPEATHPKISQVDFPVDSIVQLGGSEYVRITSVAIGKDGVQSFRCSTTGTHAAGEAITGFAGFRCALANTHVGGEALVDKALTVTIVPVAPDPNPEKSPAFAIGGMRGGGIPLGGFNLATINGRSTLPEDDIRLSIRFDKCTAVQTVRIYFSVEPGVTQIGTPGDFTSNYYFFEWRQNDLAAAIQSQNTEAIDTVQAARDTVAANASVNQAIPRRGPSGATPNANSGSSSGPTATTALSSQLALGNNQWLELKCKVKDLTQIGTDPSRNLATVTAIEVLITVENQTVVASFDAIWLSGGFSPDPGIGDPYVWSYRFRSSKTGAVSNPSPPLRGGVRPLRQSVLLTAQTSGDAQVDLVDWFRLGGALPAWTYVGTVPNGQTFLDVYGDTDVDGGETLEFDNFPPWPTQDLPRAGTCNIAGSAVQYVSGDQFNTNWQPGSLIILNGQAYTIYSVPSSTKLFLHQNAGSGSGVSFRLTGPTLIGQNFGSIWAGPVAGNVFFFACRDPIDPGMVHWCKGNNPEASSDKASLQVTTGAEPLQAGFMWDGASYVASTENIYALEATSDPNAPFRPLITPAGRGFWTPFAWCLAPEGVYFLAKDGIFLSTAGSAAISITDDDLAPLFPKNGQPGQAVNGFFPVAMGTVASVPSGAGCAGTTFCDSFGCPLTTFPDLRLAYIDGWVIFDYADTSGNRRTISYHVATKSWWPDVYTPGLNMHEAGTGRTIHESLIGGVDGQLYVQGGLSDDCTAIPYRFVWVDNQGDARRFKLYRDVFLKADLSGSVATARVSFTDQSAALSPVTLTGLLGVSDYLIDTVPRMGMYGTNITIDVRGTPATPTSPIWWATDVAFQPQPELASSWLSGPTTHGLRGFQQVQRAQIAYLSSGPVTLSVIIDGTLYTYALAGTGGQYAKQQVVLQAVKGETFQWGMQGAPFLLFDKDMELWVQPWGQSGGYQTVRPF